MIGLLQPGVRDHQPAAVQHQVRHQAAAELADLTAELLVLAGQLAQRLGQPVADLDVLPGQRPDQLVLVVARDGQRLPGGDHAHDQPEHAGRIRAAVHQVAEEHRGPARRGHRAGRPPGGVPGDLVAEPAEQRLQFGPAAVHVADDVERPGPVGVVGQQPVPHDAGRRHLVRPAQHVHHAEPFPAERPQRPAQLVMLPVNDLAAERPVGPARRCAEGTHFFRHVQHDGDRQHVVRAGQFDEWFARLGLHVGRVDHGQPARGQPLARDVAEHVERVPGGGLVVLVVGHQAAAEVAGDDLEPAEVLARRTWTCPTRTRRPARPGTARGCR